MIPKNKETSGQIRRTTNIVYLHDSEEQGDIRANTPDEIQNSVSASKLIKDRLILFSIAKVLNIHEVYVRTTCCFQFLE